MEYIGEVNNYYERELNEFNSLDEKLKALDILTTGAPLNGNEKWDEVLKNARDELIHRRSKFVEPTFYFELKFILQMTTLLKMKEKSDALHAVKADSSCYRCRTELAEKP